MSRKPPKDKPYEYNYEKLAEASEDITPKAKGSIPKLAVLLGLLSPFYYDLYLKCDGSKTISDLAKDLKVSVDEMKIYLDKLYKNGLIVFLGAI